MIANLKKAGIKLWVLAGDKREMAIEIGYSTKVPTPKMHLTEVVNGPSQSDKALVTVELMKHIKIGNLPDYQLAALDEVKGFSSKSVLHCLTVIKNWRRKSWPAFRYFYLTKIRPLWLSKDSYADHLEDIKEEMEAEGRRADPRIQRRNVSKLAKEIIKNFWVTQNMPT